MKGRCRPNWTHRKWRLLFVLQLPLFWPAACFEPLPPESASAGLCLPGRCTPSGLLGGDLLQRDNVDCILDDGSLGPHPEMHEPFEWFDVEFETFADRFFKIIGTTNLWEVNVLQVGCGNSALGELLYDRGFTNLTSLDIRQVAIKQMVARNIGVRPDMNWVCADVRRMSRVVGSGKYDVVLDRGTLDHLLAAKVDPTSYLMEVVQVLRPGGVFLCISNGLATSSIFDGVRPGFLVTPSLRVESVLEFPSLSRVVPYLGYVGRRESNIDLAKSSFNHS